MKQPDLRSADFTAPSRLPNPSAKTETIVAKRGNRQTRIPEILAAAASLFAREGYAGFTTRRVAQETGLRLSTLQHYFDTRDTLLRATIERLVDGYHQRFQAALENRAQPPLERLEALLELIFEEFTRPGTAALWVEVWATANHESFIAPLEAHAYEAGTGYVESLIAELNPALAAEECAVRAMLISLKIEGLMVLARRYAGRVPHSEALLASIKNVCRAIATAPA